MSDGIKRQVDTDSTEFSEGVEAGLNSAEDTKNWKAGNKIGQALKDNGETEAPAVESFSKEYPAPLFVKNSPEGSKGNAQDEKDETEE